jgi:D-alanyl-D-alanine carboxypeptidase (penicillin-binding protein 5/6)
MKSLIVSRSARCWRHGLVLALLSALPFMSIAASAPVEISAPVLQSSVPVPAVVARAWAVVDLNSQQILASQGLDEPVEPASLTKIMTAYLVFEALREKRLTLDQQVTVSERAWRAPGSRMFLELGKPVSVRDLLLGMIVQSGNDASIALAEAVAGTEEAFARLMTEEARRLGMRNTRYTNSTGLPDPQHTTTVRDLAILAAALIRNHPDHYGFYRERSFTWNNITQSNRNRLLHTDPTVDGLKTGHTQSAGFCLIASSLRSNRRLVSVVVGADSDAARTQDSLKLLNWGFQNFDAVELYAGGQAVVTPTVWKGAVAQARLGAVGPVWVTVPRGQAGQLRTSVERPDPLIAPLQQGQAVGTLTVSLGQAPVRSIPLVVQESVPVAGFFGRLWDSVRLWFD